MLPRGSKIAYRAAVAPTEPDATADGLADPHYPPAQESVRRSERMRLWRQPRSDPQPRAADRRFAAPRS